MKLKRVLILIPIFLLSGCYAHGVFKNNTGLEFGEEVNLCPGAGVQSQKTCEPTSDGWKKANKVTPATLVSGEKIFQRIENDYLLQRLTGNQKTNEHNFDLWGSSLNNPKSEIGVQQYQIVKNALIADYVVEPFSQVNMSELYEKEALTEAVSVLKTEAKEKNIELNADFVLNVKSELQKKIKNSKNTNFTYHHIIAEYVGPLSIGEDDEQLQSIPALNKSMSLFNNGKEIIVGISGILFGKLTSKQTVVEESMLSTSIDASLNLAQPEQVEIIQDLKLSVSSKWSNKVNENINTTIITQGTGVFFYPLWVKTVVKGL